LAGETEPSEGSDELEQHGVRFGYLQHSGNSNSNVAKKLPHIALS